MFIVGTAGTLLPGIHKSCREEDGKDSDLLSRQLIFLSVSHIFFAERRRMVEKVPKKSINCNYVKRTGQFKTETRK